MNGLKYLVVVSMLLALPVFAQIQQCRVDKHGKTHCKPVHQRPAVEVDNPSYMVDDPADPAPMMTDSTGCIPECKLVTPMLKAGEVCIKSRESCPPSKFRICKDINIIQDFEIEGGCKQECVKCDEFGACKVVPNGCCCKETCCKPVCKERCCRPRCQRERCCPRRGCCR